MPDHSSQRVTVPTRRPAVAGSDADRLVLACGSLAEQVTECPALRDELDGIVMFIPSRGREQPILIACAPSNFPTDVVKQQVMMSTEKDAVGQIRSASVPGPEHDVMRLAPGWRTITARRSAPAPHQGERFFLSPREEALLPTEIEHLPRLVEDYGSGFALAGHPFEGRNGYRSRLTFDTNQARA
jgi:hypothetical protein